MNVSPDALRKETVMVLGDIEKQLQAIRKEAAVVGVEPYTFRDANGSWVLSPLLQAKAQCLATLTQLNQPSPRRGKA